MHVDFHVAVHPRGPTDDCLRALAELLRQRHLHVYARLHQCRLCAQIPRVSVDGKVSFAAAVCSSMEGPVLQVGSVRQLIPRGCLEFPVLGRRTCRQHSDAGPADVDAAAAPK